MTVRLAMLVSGSGTTLQNFLDVTAAGKLDARIVVIVSSNSTAFALERARKAGIPAHVVRRRDFETLEQYGEAITAALEPYEPDLVIGAGFLQRYIFPPRYEGRMLNVHPGLLPQYGGQGMYGHHVHEAVIEAGERESGCSVIIADHEYDHGPTIVERRVPVLPDDTPETLAARVFEVECEAYPEAVRIVAAKLGIAATIRTRMPRSWLWQRLDTPGLEHFLVDGTAEGVVLNGEVVASIDGERMRLHYTVRCNVGFEISSLEVICHADVERRLALSRDAGGRWTNAAGHELPEISGCDDVDIAASPSTNTLPIRRLTLTPGASAEVRVVYVEVPRLSVSVDRQKYTLLRHDSNESVYRFESFDAVPGFVAEVTVDPDGFVTEYEGLFRRL